MLQKIDIITIFPELITSYTKESIIGRAINTNKITINAINLRDYTSNKHKKVDDIPYGGSTGMVIQFEPIKNALSSLKTDKTYTVALSPSGKTFNNTIAKTLFEKEHLILLAGHYEGFDQRIYSLVDTLISIGDYVLTGGELPALIITDCLTRFLPNVLGNNDSLKNDSFYNGLLDWDVFTRPRNFDKLGVPEVLFSGNHKKIQHFKERSAIINTFRSRPELFAAHKFNKTEQNIFKEFMHEEAKE